MDEDDFISKTRRKRQSTDLQKVGAELVKLSAEQLARIRMPESLLEAVLECKRLTTHEAIRRQMQYIGKIMRDIEAEPIMTQLEALHAPSRRQTALFHVAEKWRTELLADPQNIARFAGEFPEADIAKLRELVEKAQKERVSGSPPKHYRELFHVVNTILQDHASRQS
jgi:ribosome-associated protein